MPPIPMATRLASFFFFLFSALLRVSDYVSLSHTARTSLCSTPQSQCSLERAWNHDEPMRLAVLSTMLRHARLRKQTRETFDRQTVFEKMHAWQ